MFEPINALGGPLEPCSRDPLTGFYRDGSCNSGNDNPGVHAVCIYATQEFLDYSKQAGNDLSTPMPQYNFPGVKAGQSWCLSGPRFVQAIKDGMTTLKQDGVHKVFEGITDMREVRRVCVE